jgi:hypothetical protein
MTGGPGRSVRERAMRSRAERGRGCVCWAGWAGLERGFGLFRNVGLGWVVFISFLFLLFISFPNSNLIQTSSNSNQI